MRSSAVLKNALNRLLARAARYRAATAKELSISLIAMIALATSGALQYEVALPGYRYDFPRDYFNHPEYRTEWWYYTGNLRTAQGRRFGFELTFFRQGTGTRLANVWDVGDIWLAHLALSDVAGNRFLHTERVNRTGAGLAGADLAQARVWNGNWQVRWTGDRQRLSAIADDFSFDLDARSRKPPVIHGHDGISQKAPGRGRASHYISLTRLETHGVIRLRGQPFTVEGLVWMDHEFFTNQLDSDQIGWDWFSLQMDDGTELMLYRLRRADGKRDPFSAGTFVDTRGRTRELTAGDFTLTPGRTWRKYPIEWRIAVLPLAFSAAVTTSLPQQEITSPSRAVSSYWEGAIEIRGMRQGKSIQGAGYLEMTGYNGPVHFQ